MSKYKFGGPNSFKRGNICNDPFIWKLMWILGVRKLWKKIRKFQVSFGEFLKLFEVIKEYLRI